MNPQKQFIALKNRFYNFHFKLMHLHAPAGYAPYLDGTPAPAVPPELDRLYNEIEAADHYTDLPKDFVDRLNVQVYAFNKRIDDHNRAVRALAKEEKRSRRLKRPTMQSKARAQQCRKARR